MGTAADDRTPRRMIVHQELDRAIAQAVLDQPALMTARAEWDRLAGVVHDDEPLFEERASAFLEWFLIDFRPGGRAPIEAQIQGAQATGPADQARRDELAALACSHRSLFQVRTAFSDGVLLDDLWGGGTFRVHERRQLAGLGPGELFDGRLIADVSAPPELLFARTFCFHPREAEEGVRSQVIQARRDRRPREELLFRLLRLRVRCERYRHVKPSRVYAALLDPLS
ncbi:MAG: hypothetical protein EXR72_01915 [Myxococcales bacterium]|nr:hypothetical protein [Myxococcales bacterium]